TGTGSAQAEQVSVAGAGMPSIYSRVRRLARSLARPARDEHAVAAGEVAAGRDVGEARGAGEGGHGRSLRGAVLDEEEAARGDGGRGRARVGRVDPGDALGAELRERQRDRAASRPDVRRERAREAARLLEGGVDEHFGLRPRNQHVARDLEVERVELAPPREI